MSDGRKPYPSHRIATVRSLAALGKLPAYGRCVPDTKGTRCGLCHTIVRDQHSSNIIVYSHYK
jgi:hypothetical protein